MLIEKRSSLVFTTLGNLPVREEIEEPAFLFL